MNPLIKKKILITGGLGFIGSNLARRLAECGNEVTVVDSLIPEYGGNLRNLHDFHEKIIIVVWLFILLWCVLFIFLLLLLLFNFCVLLWWVVSLYLLLLL